MKRADYEIGCFGTGAITLKFFMNRLLAASLPGACRFGVKRQGRKSKPARCGSAPQGPALCKPWGMGFAGLKKRYASQVGAGAFSPSSELRPNRPRPIWRLGPQCRPPHDLNRMWESSTTPHACQ